MTRARLNWGAVRARLFSATGRQGLSLAVAHGVTVVAGLGVGILLARGLGVEGYGQYVFVLTIVQVMMVPLDFGLPTLVMREVAILRARADWSQLTGLLRWSTLLVTGVLAALSISTLAWSEFVGGETALYLAAVVLAGMWAYMRIAAAVLRGMKNVAWAAMPDQVIRPLTLFAALALVSVVGALSPARAMALHALAAAVGLVWALFLLRTHSRPVPAGEAGDARYTQKAWIRSAFYLGLSMGGALLKRRSDVLMLGLLADSRQVGLYGLALLIAGIASMPQNLVDQIAAPRFAIAHSTGKLSEIERLAFLTATFALVAALCVIVGLTLTGSALINFSVGSAFSSALPLALVLATGPAVSSIFGPAALINNMTGHEKTTARQSWISATLNIGLNAALIPLIGGYGAAIATATTQIIQRFFLWRAVRINIGVDSSILTLIYR